MLPPPSASHHAREIQFDNHNVNVPDLIKKHRKIQSEFEKDASLNNRLVQINSGKNKEKLIA
jgi:hypothetical protein